MDSLVWGTLAAAGLARFMVGLSSYSGACMHMHSTCGVLPAGPSLCSLSGLSRS